MQLCELLVTRLKWPFAVKLNSIPSLVTSFSSGIAHFLMSWRESRPTRMLRTHGSTFALYFSCPSEAGRFYQFIGQSGISDWPACSAPLIRLSCSVSLWRTSVIVVGLRYCQWVRPFHRNDLQLLPNILFAFVKKRREWPKKFRSCSARRSELVEIANVQLRHTCLFFLGFPEPRKELVIDKSWIL